MWKKKNKFENKRIVKWIKNGSTKIYDAETFNVSILKLEGRKITKIHNNFLGDFNKVSENANTGYFYGYAINHGRDTVFTLDNDEKIGFRVEDEGNTLIINSDISEDYDNYIELRYYYNMEKLCQHLYNIPISSIEISNTKKSDGAYIDPQLSKVARINVYAIRNTNVGNPITLSVRLEDSKAIEISLEMNIFPKIVVYDYYRNRLLHKYSKEELESNEQGISKIRYVGDYHTNLTKDQEYPVIGLNKDYIGGATDRSYFETATYYIFDDNQNMFPLKEDYAVISERKPLDMNDSTYFWCDSKGFTAYSFRYGVCWGENSVRKINEEECFLPYPYLSRIEFSDFAEFDEYSEEYTKLMQEIKEKAKSLGYKRMVAGYPHVRTDYWNDYPEELWIEDIYGDTDVDKGSKYKLYELVGMFPALRYWPNRSEIKGLTEIDLTKFKE